MASSQEAVKVGMRVPGQESSAREDKPVRMKTPELMPVPSPPKAQQAPPRTPRQDQVPGLAEAAAQNTAAQPGVRLPHPKVETEAHG